MSDKKRKIASWCVSLGVHVVILLLMLFVTLRMADKSFADDGVPVMLGDTFDGGGAGDDIYDEITPNEEVEEPMPQETVEPDIPEPVPAPKAEITQQAEKSVTVDQQEQKEKKQTPKENREEAEAKAKANAKVGGAFGAMSGAGRGDTTGDTKQGPPDGTGVDIGYSLGGRSMRGKVEPLYEAALCEGTVVVKVSVDKYGKVTAAEILSCDDTAKPLCKDAIDAAYKQRFSLGEKESEDGTITYRFRRRAGRALLAGSR